MDLGNTIKIERMSLQFKLNRNLTDTEKRLLEHIVSSSLRRHGVKIEYRIKYPLLEVTLEGYGRNQNIAGAEWRVKYFLQDKELI